MAKKAKRYHDVTVRMRRRDGQRVTREQARKALWAAHKLIQQRSGTQDDMREWIIEGIDWRVKTAPDGEPVRSYAYEGRERAWEALGALGGILETVDLLKLRVEVPE